MAELGVGDVRIIAGDRADTVVTVRPTHPGKKGDVVASEQTRVELSGGRLLIQAPKGRRQYRWWGGGESIDVEIALPAGSRVRGQAGMGALRCSGRLGDCIWKTGLGEIQLETAGTVQVKTGMGDVTVDVAEQRVEVTTGSGSVRIGRVAGTGVIKSSDGDVWIGDAHGELQVKTANGKISVDRAQASASAKTANGDVRLGEVCQGTVIAETARGQLDIGIRDGVPAWLDLTTRFGAVHNHLDAAAPPASDEQAVAVRARTSLGDITARRVKPSVDGLGEPAT
ncbi:MAG TPA: DUF4097 family beta strand repeat-containing protein [Candidatus Dormibacteraeota bacterium]